MRLPEVQRFSPEGDPETPYTRAKKEWDDRIGSARVQAFHWRAAFFASALLCVVLASGLIYLSSRQHAVPYIIEVDRLGRVQNVGAVTQVSSEEPGVEAVKYFLAQFVINVRSLPLDPVVVRKNWLSAYDFVTERAHRELNNLARSSEPFLRVGKETVSVDITSVVPVSEKSFQIQWEETLTNQFGAVTARPRYTGIFNILIKKPETEEEIMKNPLGIMIDSFNISKQI